MGRIIPYMKWKIKKCLKPPTSNKSIYTIYRYLNYIHIYDMIWSIFVDYLHLQTFSLKPLKLVHLQTIYLQHSDKTINFATFTHQSILIKGYNPIPLIWWFNCYAMVNVYPLFTPTNHWPIDLNGDHLIHTPDDPMVSGWNHIFGLTYCVPFTKLTRTLNISIFCVETHRPSPYDSQGLRLYVFWGMGRLLTRSIMAVTAYWLKVSILIHILIIIDSSILVLMFLCDI